MECALSYNTVTGYSIVVTDSDAMRESCWNVVYVVSVWCGVMLMLGGALLEC